jgi:hypothetical protein
VDGIQRAKRDWLQTACVVQDLVVDPDKVDPAQSVTCSHLERSPQGENGPIHFCAGQGTGDKGTPTTNEAA